MIELLDPLYIDPVAFGEKRIQKIEKFSLLPGKRIGWNYYMDYTWLDLQLEGTIKKGMVIFDVGCGPGAIHGYLEDKYKINIIGIDMNRWKEDYVSYVGDFASSLFWKKIGIRESSIDLIISTSAFEHNTPRKHRILVRQCLKALKKGGRLVTTFAAAKKTGYFGKSNQWNLCKRDIEIIYGEEFSSFNFDDVRKRWKKHRVINEALRKRFGFSGIFFPSFISAGANILKK